MHPLYATKKITGILEALGEEFAFFKKH